jgi:tRNA (guanine-N7-)-methyltransferase
MSIQQSPTKTTDINWLEHYPTYKPDNPIRHADIGCGYGGLLITLSEMFEDKLSIGMEIRVKVSDYVMVSHRKVN